MVRKSYRSFIESNYKELLEILNCLKVGVYIVDGDGNTVMLNDESCKTGGLAREETIGKNMKDLEKSGFIEESVSLNVLASGKEEALIQNLGDGDKVYVTGLPIYGEGGIDIVVCTERDITETINLQELLEEKTKENVRTKEEVEYLKKQNIVMWGNMIAEEEKTKALAEKAARVAKLDATVLLTGESGTGKEVFANFIYQNSERVGKPFIKVNCAAIPDSLMESELFGYEKGAFSGADKNGKIGLFEMAHHGTLLLDEVGEIPVHLQSKLLRAIQEKEIMRVGGTKKIQVDIRLIAATNRDLKAAVEDGSFREDLYYRLNVMPLKLEPLRGRKKDISALARYFVKKFNTDYKMTKTISPEAMDVLQNFAWPGNVRELENVVERLMIGYDEKIISRQQAESTLGLSEKREGVDLSDIEGKTMQELMDEYEKYILESMLGKYKKASQVGRALNMNKSTLSRRMKKYSLE